jgi:hypothetical protein
MNIDQWKQLSTETLNYMNWSMETTRSPQEDWVLCSFSYQWNLKCSQNFKTNIWKFRTVKTHYHHLAYSLSKSTVGIILLNIIVSSLPCQYLLYTSNERRMEHAVWTFDVAFEEINWFPVVICNVVDCHEKNSLHTEKLLHRCILNRFNSWKQQKQALLSYF